MAVISFWSNERSATGKTSAVVAISTYLSIHHNYKILILDTKQNDYSYQDCYWKEDKLVKQINIGSGKINIASGLSGLSKAILSNKTSPEIITNYTKIVFKDVLEVLTDENISDEEYETHKKVFKDIAKIASKYYDLVFIDIDTSLDRNTVNSLLEVSDLIIPCLSQKLRKINSYKEIKEKDPLFNQKVVLPLLGRYDAMSKYNSKNVARYLKEKNGVLSIPYNTLFFEASNEGTVAEFFIKLARINPKDKNAIFINDVKTAAEKIIYTLQELRMRM